MRVDHLFGIHEAASQLERLYASGIGARPAPLPQPPPPPAPAIVHQLPPPPVTLKPHATPNNEGPTVCEPLLLYRGAPTPCYPDYAELTSVGRLALRSLDACAPDFFPH